MPFPVAEARERQHTLADFRSFYLEHVEFVRRVVARLCGPSGDIDDLVQEVFLVALRKRSSFAGRAAPSTWLYAIAQRLVMAARRRARVHRFFGLNPDSSKRTTATPQQIFEHRCLVHESHGDGIAAENALLALGLLERNEGGNRRRALAALREHQRRFPAGILAPEVALAIPARSRSRAISSRPAQKRMHSCAGSRATGEPTSGCGRSARPDRK